MFPLSTECVFYCSQIWLVNRRKEKKKEAKKEHSESAFSECFEPFLELVLHEQFPFTESLGSCISPASVQMLSADLRQDAAGITVNFVSSCTVGQLLGEEIMQTTCGIHLGCLWHSTGSLALTQLHVGSCYGP